MIYMFIVVDPVSTFDRSFLNSTPTTILTFVCTGDERSSDTLYSISIRIGFSETETENYTKLYETNAITPADYVIPEDVLHAFEK